MGEHPLGFRTLTGVEDHLWGTAVRSKWQGEGVADGLLNWAASSLAAEGHTKATLTTTVADYLVNTEAEASELQQWEMSLRSWQAAASLRFALASLSRRSLTP